MVAVAISSRRGSRPLLIEARRFELAPLVEQGCIAVVTVLCECREDPEGGVEKLPPGMRV